jgi:uncharacterized repeat protein (TIGR01451 family)
MDESPPGLDALGTTQAAPSGVARVEGETAPFQPPPGEAEPEPVPAAPQTDYQPEATFSSPLDTPGAESAQQDENEPAVGRPGPRELEGSQAPALTIEKIAPERASVGQATTFQTKVRNVGPISADRVLIRDEIPQGTRLIDTNPQATRTSDGALMWQLGTLRPGDEVLVSMNVAPIDEGQIGSVATVSFQASASARATVTRPLLELEHTGPRQVLLGDPVKFAIRLSNPGSGSATQVVLEEDVPAGLSHPSGPQLEYHVGTIQPGSTRNLELTLKAARAGTVENVLVARGDDGLVAEHRFTFEVVAPDLQVKIDGPTRRYLERSATYTVSVLNPGTAPAHEVDLMTRLPRGLKFVSTNNSGRYDPTEHAIRWSLEKLPAGQFGKVQFTALPIEMGSQSIAAEAKAQMGLVAEQHHEVAVEGIAALLFVVVDKVDPIEVGGSTTYEIRVRNQGSKTATDIQFVAQAPAGLKPLRGEGPTRARVDGQRVAFEALPRLAPKEEATFRIHVQGTQSGDHRFRVQMVSGETTAPVIKEESTRVYADQ